LAHAELFSTDMLRVSAIEVRMVAAANLVEVAAFVGDAARAAMLNALMGQGTTTTTSRLSPPYPGDRRLEKSFWLLARAVDEQLRGLLHRQISGLVAFEKSSEKSSPHRQQRGYAHQSCRPKVPCAHSLQPIG
jgi:hypothetical protein